MNFVRKASRVMCAAGAFCAALSAPATSGEPSILSLETGHSIVLKTPHVTRVAVGDGRIAGLVPVGRDAVIINGKTAGHTTVFVWEGDRQQIYQVTVAEQSFEELARILRTTIAEPDVRVESVGKNIFVRGTVPDVAAYNHVNDVLKSFDGFKLSGGTSSGDKIPYFNAVTVSKPLGNLQDQIARIATGDGVRADMDSTGNVVVSGSVRDARQEQEVIDRVKTLAGPYLRTDGKVVDRLGVQTTSQVDVKVYVLEVDNTATSDLGLRLQTAFPSSVGASGGTYTLSSTPSLTALEKPGLQRPFGLGAFSRISLLAPTLDLLLQEGHAKLLSSPNLVTEPGQEASFLVGGEVPIPVSNGLGTISVDYKEFGVKLNVTPTILGNGGVETKIAPEISDLDFADGISLNGFIVPAFKTSKLSTDVITQSGESIIMGGLIRRQEQRTIQKFPILGDIPILGQLFRSTNYQKTNTDVVFVMTPTIITK